MFQKNIVEYGWNDKYGWGWRWIWINSLPGMCHVKRTSQAKLSIFVTFWDSFMTHVLTWRNRGTLLYYGFSHLKMTLVHCCILNSPLSDWILSRPRPWAQQLLVALQKWPPKVCKNGPTDAKLQKFIENSLQKPMVPGYLCPFPTSGAGRRDAVSKPYVKRETFYTAPLQREVTKIRHIWHDTWQFMVALDLHFQSTLASSEGAHWILEEMPDVFEWILVKFQNDWTWTQQKNETATWCFMAVTYDNLTNKRESKTPCISFRWVAGTLALRETHHGSRASHKNQIINFQPLTWITFKALNRKKQIEGVSNSTHKMGPQKVSNCKHKRSHLHQACNEFPHLQWTFPAKTLHWQFESIIGS